MNTIVALVLLVAMWKPLSALAAMYVGVRGFIAVLALVLVPVFLLA